MAQSYSSTGARATVSKNKNLAGQTVYKDGYETHYDENGRVKYSVKADDPTYRGTVDKTMADNGYTTNQHMDADKASMSQADLSAIAAIRAQGESGAISWADANAQANAIRDKYGYGISQEGLVYNPEGLQNSLNAAATSEATKYYDKATNTFKDMDTLPAVTTSSAGGTTNSTQQTTTKQPATQTKQTANTAIPKLPGLSLDGLNTPTYQNTVSAPTLGNNAVAAPEYQNTARLPTLGGTSVEEPQFSPQQIAAPEFDRSDVTVQEVTPYEVQDNSQYLKDLYAANVEAELANLAAAYEANAGTLQRAGDKISDTYQAQQNLAAAQNALAQQTMNEYAAAAGLNTGTAGQMALAQNASLQGQLGTLGAQEAQAIVDNQAAQDELARQYELAIVSAKASGNTQLANALYQEMTRQDTAKQNAYLTALEQANFEAQLQMQNQQNRNQLAQQEFSNALTQQQYSDQMLQQAYQNALAQQQYTDQLAQQNFQNQLTMDQYGNDLLQQQYQNALAQQQYADQLAQQNFNNQLTVNQYDNELLAQQYADQMAMQQYLNQLNQQNYENQFAQTQYQNQLTQQQFENDYLLRQYADKLAQQSYENALAQQKPTAIGSTGSTSKKNEMTLTTAKALMKAGEFTEDAVNTMLAAGFTPGYLKAEYGYTGNAHIEKVPVTPQDYGTVQQESASGNYGPKFNIALNKLQILQQKGATQEELSASLLADLESGNVTLAGAESLMKALGI